MNAFRKNMLALIVVLAVISAGLSASAFAAEPNLLMESEGKPLYRDQTLQMIEGETLQLSFKLEGEDGSIEDITESVSYQFSREGYFSVDENGLLTALKSTGYSAYRVEVTYDDRSNYFFVLVREPIAQFTDIDGHWAREAIQWAAERRITRGYGDNTFRPDRVITEEEFLAFFVRPRVDPAILVRGEYDFAEMRNMPVLGLDDLKARAAPIKRAKVAEIIAAADGMHYTGDHAIQYVLGKGYSNGKTEATIEGYKGDDYLTRAEALTFSYQLFGRITDIQTMPEEPSPVSELPPLP